MRVGAVCRHYHHVRVSRPTIVYLDIGTNDLSNPWCNPRALASSIYRCACELQEFVSVRHVIIGEIMRRRDPCRSDFEAARNDANSELRRLVEGVPPSTCITIGLCPAIGNSIISVMVYISPKRVWVGIANRSVSACGTSSSNKIVVIHELVSVWLIFLSIFLSYLPMCHQSFISQCHFCIIFCLFRILYI